MVLEQECELCELNLITCIAIICTIYNLCESQDFTVSLLSAILLNCILFQQKHRFKWNLTQMTISFCHTGYPWSFFQHISLLQLSQLFSSTILIIIFYKPHQALKEMFLLRNSSAA